MKTKTHFDRINRIGRKCRPAGQNSPTNSKRSRKAFLFRPLQFMNRFEFVGFLFPSFSRLYPRRPEFAFVSSLQPSIFALFLRIARSRFKVQGSMFKVRGSKFKVLGSRFKVPG